MPRPIKNPRVFFIRRTISALARHPVQSLNAFYHPIRDIINCGAQRSGSTLLHNIIQEILFIHYRSSYNFCKNERDYLSLQKNSMNYNFIKIHAYSPVIARRVAAGRSIGFFTHRDLRDIMASKIQKGSIESVEAFISSGRLRRLVNTALLYASTNNMNVFSYDQIMDDKQKTIIEAASVLKIKLTNQEIDHISDKTSLTNTKAKLQKTTFEKHGNNYVDKQSGLHSNHINDPATGKWKSVLSSREEKMIINEAKDYFIFFGYDC
ncbi:MAG: sulfotransferase domain-containing protein [Thermodesulfobacteriota bacterium]|nr:sulfotransferase domain-containing protein [Thermodesulfobacteriota bacterium]